jgi:hypothetical protein
VDGKMSDYDGPRTGEGIVDFILKKYRNVNSLLFRLPMSGSETEAMADRHTTIQARRDQVTIRT